MKLKPILPLWLLLAIAIGLLGILITRCLLAKKDTPANTAKYLAPKIAIILLLFVVGLRPMIIGGDISQVQTNNLDVLFVVDNTISMNAEDYNGNNTRLSAVKADMSTVFVDYIRKQRHDSNTLHSRPEHGQSCNFRDGAVDRIICARFKFEHSN